MKRILLIVLILSSIHSRAQITWVSDLELAQSMAIAQNKLIVIDFWATWCGPCKTMDREMWNNEIINDVKENFIGLKIDIDVNKGLAQNYGVKSIPNVIIIDPAENKLWSQIGYSSPSPYISILEQLPRYTVDDNLIAQEIKNKSNQMSWNLLGVEYQVLGNSTESVKFKNAFFNISNKYFKKSIKNGNDSEIATNSSYNLILNDAYNGKVKKALKQALKEEDPSIELSNFILAYCYKCNKDKSSLEKYKKLVSSPDLLAQLE